MSFRAGCRVSLQLLIVAGLFMVRNVFADVTVFGPRTYAIPSNISPLLLNTPVTFKNTFCIGKVVLTPPQCQAASGSGFYVLRIANRGITSAAIALDGNLVLGQNVFGQVKPAPVPSSLTLMVTLPNGPNAIDVEIEGRAGATLIVQIFKDKTSPQITAAVSPQPTADGWNNTAVTVSFVCSDSGSGIKTCPAPVFVSAEGAHQIVSGTAVDNSGNQATANVTVNIDETTPAITGTLSPAQNANGWNNTPVQVHFSCADTLSGIKTCPADQTVSIDGANQIFTGTATDKAGNTAQAQVMLNLDRTAPALTITSPANGAVVTSDNITVTGLAGDTLSGLASVTCNGQPVAVAPDNTFSNGPLPLLDGPNTFAIVATDLAGNIVQQTVSVTRPCTNFIQDPGFESGVSGFWAQDASSNVQQTGMSPLEGSHSLSVSINGYGNHVWWDYPFAGGLASRLSVSAHLRSDAASSSTLDFCAFAEYADGVQDQNCAHVTGDPGDKGIVSSALTLDPGKPLKIVHILIQQVGSAGVQFTIDSAVACLTVISGPTDGGVGGGGGTGGGGGGTGGGGGGGQGSSHYSTGYDYLAHMPPNRPFISLTPWTQADPLSQAYQMFKQSVDGAVNGNPPYAYSAADSVIMYAITGQSQYIQDAISRVEQQVTAAETAIAGGAAPDIAGDSYLDIGPDLEQVALAYDYGYDLLSDSQRQRWENYASQAVYNLWNSNQANWGGKSMPWSGWATGDPGDNYHYSFLKATMLWALATKSTGWFSFLQTQKFGPLVDYFYALPGGGSREGTGYGVSLRNLFEDYIYWKASTGEDLAGYSTHAADSIDYWVYATVPTLDRYAPIGDLSRQSYPWLYDYHENLVQTSVALNPAAGQTGRGIWWLENNRRDDVSNPGQTVPLDAAHAQKSNLKDFLLPYPDSPVPPADLLYNATAAGLLFARSGWASDASWLAFIAGKYDQSHAHQDQGSFSFFKNDWLTVTSNIWSNSGLEGNGCCGDGTAAHNVIRFVQNAAIIPQNQSSSVQSSMAFTNTSGDVQIHADLTNAYSNSSASILSWTRDLDFQGDILRVHDICSVAPGVQPIFQLHVPVQPVAQPDGSIQAGRLHIVLLEPAQAAFVAMPGQSADYLSGFRIELTVASGCDFNVELQAQ